MATKNIVPRANEEGNIGTSLKNWLKGWFKDIFVSGVLTDGTNSVTIAALASETSVFGSEYQSEESLSQSATTSSSMQQKVRLSTPSGLPAGTYRIGWSFLYGQSSIVDDFRARLQLDNTTDIMNINVELQDSNSIVPACGFAEVVLSSGTHTFDLDFSAEGNTAYISDARLEFWRVS